MGKSRVRDFSCEGAHPPNVGGQTAKGWRVWRVNRTVFRHFGPIEVVGGGGGRRHWLSPVPKTPKTRHVHPSEKAAQAAVKALICEKTSDRPDRGQYRELPRRIRAPRKRE